MNQLFESVKEFVVHNFAGVQPQREGQVEEEEVEDSELDLFTEEAREQGRREGRLNRQGNYNPHTVEEGAVTYPKLPTLVDHNTSSQTGRKRKLSGTQRTPDERRLLGDYHIPHDATPITIPENRPTPPPLDTATMPGKPYGGWKPTDTLNAPNKFNPARANPARTYGKVRPPFSGQALGVEISRGDNVTTPNRESHNFPDGREDQVKRRKVATPSKKGNPAYATHHTYPNGGYVAVAHPDDVEHFSQLESRPSQRSSQHQGSYVSQTVKSTHRGTVLGGSQESNSVEARMGFAKKKGKPVNGNGNGDNAGTLGQPIDVDGEDDTMPQAPPSPQPDVLGLLDAKLQEDVSIKGQSFDKANPRRPAANSGETRSHHFEKNATKPFTSISSVDLTEDKPDAPAVKDRKHTYKAVRPADVDLTDQTGVPEKFIQIYDESMQEQPLRRRFVRKDDTTPPPQTPHRREAPSGSRKQMIGDKDELSLSSPKPGKATISCFGQTLSDVRDERDMVEVQDSDGDEPSADIPPTAIVRGSVKKSRKDKPKGKPAAYRLTYYKANAEKKIIAPSDDLVIMRVIDQEVYSKKTGKMISAYKEFVFHQSGAELPAQYSIDTRKITRAECSFARDSTLLRLSGSGYVFYDMVLSSVQELKMLLDELKGSVAGLKTVDRPSATMSKFFESASSNNRNRSHAPAVDEGQEDAVMNQRVLEKHRRADPGRPKRKGLIVDLQESARPSTRAALGDIQYEEVDDSIEISDQAYAEQMAREAAPPRRSARESRAIKYLNSPTPEPEPVKLQSSLDKGPPWDQSVVYPSTGKKRATVNYSDLEKLDDGEFLNDSIIEFYIRWMHEREKERGNLKNDQVYFFSTYFYSALTAPATGRRGLNYEAVQRWTSKDDIFDHDFVVIPVNEHLHWYLAVVCNLSKIKRKFESELVEDEIQESIEPSQEDEDANADVTLAELAEPNTSPDHDPSPGLHGRMSQVRIEGSPEPAGDSASAPEPYRTSATGEVDLVEMEGADARATDRGGSRNRSPASRHLTPAMATSDLKSLPSSAVATAGSPATSSKKGRRKSAGPPPKKYSPETPAVVIIDSMGVGRSKTIANIKEYLIREADDKRGMTITKDDLQGMNAKVGIPQQENFYDCGVHLCGYVDRLMNDPKTFGQKLLAQKFTTEDEEWPNRDTVGMRNNILAQLQVIAKEQQVKREADKAAKKAAKKKAKLAGGGGAVDGVSSPPAVQATPTATAPPSRQASAPPSRQGTAPPASSQVASRQTSPVKPTPRQKKATTPVRDELRATTPEYRQRSSHSRPRSASPRKSDRHGHRSRERGDDALEESTRASPRNRAPRSSPPERPSPKQHPRYSSPASDMH